MGGKEEKMRREMVGRGRGVRVKTTRQVDRWT